jgi:hypothetical protein
MGQVSNPIMRYGWRPAFLRPVGGGGTKSSTVREYSIGPLDRGWSAGRSQIRHLGATEIGVEKDIVERREADGGK